MTGFDLMVYLTNFTWGKRLLQLGCMAYVGLCVLGLVMVVVVKVAA